MYRGQSVGVVVPCYNESLLVARVVNTMPECVDYIYLVDDCSTDETLAAMLSLQKDSRSKAKICILQHDVNQGVGAAIATGYKRALADQVELVAVMAGDAQMDPDDLEALLEPVANGEADFSKGNRLFTGDAWNVIPRVRYLGNSMLSLLTKIASGYWHIADSQSGYTVINLKGLRLIDWDLMYKRYGQPNDLLVRLNVSNLRVKDVPVRPIYNIGEKSGVKPIRMIPKLSFLIFRLFFYRMVQKYVIRDFHPLIFFYMAAIFLLPIGLAFGFYLFFYRVFVGPIADTSALFSVVFIITGMQFLFFGMWLDMESNKDLR